MKKTDNWELLRGGLTAQAIKRIESAYRKLPVPHMVIELGVAYLFAREYQIAWQHFSKAIKANNRPVSDFFGLAGVAKWCLGDFKEAVRQWNSGLNARFSDTAGLGVRLPLLLYAQLL
jgi:hypothetical protein